MVKKNTFVKHVLQDFKIIKMKKEYIDIKNIISAFIKKPAEQIAENTIIDKTVVQGSILIHRMYAEIADIGYVIDNYNEVKTFHELLQKLNNENNIKIQEKVIPSIEEKNTSNNNSIGIDIEDVVNFKETSDYREDNFYKQNFTDKEIAYCLLQPDILQSFAGKFAAKEAIVKADNYYKKISFNQIEILNDLEGKPIFQDFQISISHTKETAVAVAFKIKEKEELIKEDNRETDNNNSNIKYLSIGALLLSIIALGITLFQLL